MKEGKRDPLFVKTRQDQRHRHNFTFFWIAANAFRSQGGGERGGRGDETTYARHSRAIVAFCGDKLQSLFLWELSPVSDGYSFRVHSADLVIPTRPSILIEIRLVQTWRFRDRPTIVRYPFEHFQSPIFFFVQQ